MSGKTTLVRTKRIRAALRRGWGIGRSLLIYRRPGRQRALRRLYAAFVEPSDLAFDVGAHLGDRTEAFRALGARVIALEPQPRLYRWLQRLQGRSERVTLLPMAVGSHPGEASLALSDATPTVSTLAEDWRAGIGTNNTGFRHVRWERSVTVQVTTLDALVQSYGLPRFCKIDVEGYEAAVLQGLSQPIPALSVEFVQGALAVARDCVAQLHHLGSYRFNVIAGEGRHFRWGTWRSAEDTLHWLTQGADNLPSGDLYARMESSVVNKVR